MGKTLPKPFNGRGKAHIRTDIPENNNAQVTNKECWGCNKGEAPPNRGGVPQYTLSRKTTPPQHTMLQNHAGALRAWGPMGVYTPGGIQMCRGAYECTGGCTNMGASNHPRSIKACLPLKVGKNPYLKLNSYT